MAAIVKAGKIRQVETAFTVSMSFERGLAALMRSPTVTGMSEGKQAEVRDLIESVRLRLGLQSPEAATGEGPARPVAPPEPTIVRGDRLMVVYRGQATTFDVDVSAIGPEGARSAPGRGGQPPRGDLAASLRQGRSRWEFDAPVVVPKAGRSAWAGSGGPGSSTACFPRVPTSKPAQVANFPFKAAGSWNWPCRKWWTGN